MAKKLATDTNGRPSPYRGIASKEGIEQKSGLNVIRFPGGSSPYIHCTKPSKGCMDMCNEDDVYRQSYNIAMEDTRTLGKTDLYRKYGREYNAFKYELYSCRLNQQLWDFRDWLHHLGPCPQDGFSIDRINPKKPYQPGNMRWASKLTQTQNRKITRLQTMPDGQRLTIRQLADHLGQKYDTVHNALSKHELEYVLRRYGTDGKGLAPQKTWELEQCFREKAGKQSGHNYPPFTTEQRAMLSRIAKMWGNSGMEIISAAVADWTAFTVFTRDQHGFSNNRRPDSPQIEFLARYAKDAQWFFENQLKEEESSRKLKHDCLARQQQTEPQPTLKPIVKKIEEPQATLEDIMKWGRF